MSKYWYGCENQEKYWHDDYEECAEYIANNEMLETAKFMIMVEVVTSKKSGEKWCKFANEFIETGSCGKLNCYEGNYIPRNKKNGICKYLSWGCIETGRKWKVFPDGTFKKLSGRKE